MDEERQYSRHWGKGFIRLMCLALTIAGIFAIAYFLIMMPKPNVPQPTPSGQAAIYTTHKQHAAQMQFLRTISEHGYIHAFERNQDGTATLWVDNCFYLLSFEYKERTVIAAATYYWATVAEPRSFAIKDWRTKKTIGHFGRYGLIIYRW